MQILRILRVAKEGPIFSVFGEKHVQSMSGQPFLTGNSQQNNGERIFQISLLNMELFLFQNVYCIHMTFVKEKNYNGHNFLKIRATKLF